MRNILNQLKVCKVHKVYKVYKVCKVHKVYKVCKVMKSSVLKLKDYIFSNYQLSSPNFQLLSFVLLTFYLLLSTFNSNCYAQDDKSILDNPSYGIFGSVGLNSHTADFKNLDNIPTCCQHFESGDGIGTNFGFLYEQPLSKYFFLDLRLGLFSRSGILKADENKIVSLDGEPVTGTFEHSIDAALNTVAIQPMLGFNLISSLNFELGFNAGYSIINTFKQRETLISPTGITYENNNTTRLESNGTIPKIQQIIFGINTGLSYDIALDSKKTWFLTPEIFYNYEFNNVTTDANWKVSSLKFGLALKYSPRTEAKQKEVIPIDITPKELPVNLTASVSAYGVDANSNELDTLNLIIEEYQSRRLKPLLTYVFFDNNSAELNDKYIKISSESAKSFNVQNLNQKGTLETYYHLLNIIGKRLLENPDAKITLDGCNNGLGAEKNNKELSMRRAETIRDYFMNIWNIKSDRIKINVRNLPQEPSNNNEKEGIEENRRVEISSDTYSIIAPIFTDDTMRVANPPIVRFKTTSVSSNDISKWELRSSQQGKNIKAFSGKGEPASIVDWIFDLDEKSIPSLPAPLNYSISVTDTTGRYYTSETKSIPLKLITIEKKRRERIADKYIDRYSLILFSFDKSDVSSNNDKVLDLVRSNLKANSIIKIIGHTDKTGDDDGNLKLSYNRAVAVSKILNFNNVQSKGEGSVQQLYNNDLPEGRFYCRRVDLLVETPAE
jgi:outer membrane protein OmpA-like peptidoglycan-associated protein